VKVGMLAPAAGTGVADYARGLLEGLRLHCEAELAPARAGAWLYHLGNNQAHRAIYARALEQPGVVVLHDAVLHHFFLGSLDQQQYVEEFVYNYGAWHRGLAVELWRSRAGSGADPRYFRFPMLRRIAEAATAVVVHNPAAAAMVHEHCSGARVIEIPHFYAPPPRPRAAGRLAAFRERIGVPGSAFVFGVFGYLRETKRLLIAMRAFARLRRVFRNAALLVAGEFASRDLARAAGPMLSGPGVYRLPYLEPDEFDLALELVDACVNLRYPAAGETSGIAIRSMGLAKPVLLSAGKEHERFPEAACLRIDPGPGEPAALFEHMALLCSAPGVGLRIGRAAAAWIAGSHSLAAAAAQYCALLGESARAPAQAARR